MKKLFVGIAATVLAAAMCVSFAACGGDGGSDAKAKAVKGEEVTEAQWDAAFDALEKDDAKYTVEEETVNTATYRVDKKTGGTLTQKTVMTYINNGAKQSQKGESDVTAEGDFSFADLLANLGLFDEYAPKEGKTEVERYTEKAEGRYTGYAKDADGNWQKSASTNLVPADLKSKQGDFADYKYDAKLKGYVDKDYTAEDKIYTVYKFNGDGQLSAVYMYYTSGGGSAIESVRERSYLFTYEAAEITLPTVA